MKKIIFVGAGGFASECYSYLQDCISKEPLCFSGFLSSSNDLKPYGLESMFIGHYDQYKFKEDEYVVIAIGDPAVRMNIYRKLKERGVNFFSIVSRKANVPSLEGIGEGSVVASFSTIAMNASIGVCNIINSFCGVGHDAKIGNFNTFSSFTDICGHTQIGELNFFTSRCTVLPNAKIGNNNKFLPGSVVYKKCKCDKIMQGNPAIVVCNQGDL